MNEVNYSDRAWPRFRFLLLPVCDIRVSKVLEQEKYSLQKDVELKTRMLESLRSDYDCVKKQQKQQQQEQQEHLERSHNTVLNELNNKVQPHDVQSTRTKNLVSCWNYFLSAKLLHHCSGGGEHLLMDEELVKWVVCS